MTPLYVLTILYGAFVATGTSTSTSATVLGPNQLSKTGPMELSTCIAAANALNASSPYFHASCDQFPMMVIR